MACSELLTRFSNYCHSGAAGGGLALCAGECFVAGRDDDDAMGSTGEVLAEAAAGGEVKEECFGAAEELLSETESCLRFSSSCFLKSKFLM